MAEVLELFRRDNTQFSFLIELTLQTMINVKIFKRNEGNNRIDMANFFHDYRTFYAILDMIESAFKQKKSYSIKMMGGKEGKRRITYQVAVAGDEKPAGLTIMLLDQTIQQVEGCKNYTGKLLFAIRDRVDLAELLNIRRILNNWEVRNLNLLKPNKKD